MFNFNKKNEVTISADELITYATMTELEHFAGRTRQIIDGLEDKIANLDEEINRKIAELRDLRRIHSSQVLALRHMEDEG